MADAKILMKALTEQLTEYGNIQSQRAKIQSELLINSMKSKQNFFFKQQERAAGVKEKIATEGRAFDTRQRELGLATKRKAEIEDQEQQGIQSRIGEIQEGQRPIVPYTDPSGDAEGGYPGGYSGSAGVGQVKPIMPFREAPTARIGVGGEGRQQVEKPLGKKDYIFKRIQDKRNMQEMLEARGDPRAANFELSKAEKAYEKKWLGTEEKELTRKEQTSIDAIKADLKQGRGTVSFAKGEPQIFKIGSEKDARNYISMKGKSPEDFKEELTKWGKRKELFTGWIKSLSGKFKESEFDKHGPTWSKEEIIREFLKGKFRYKTEKGGVDVSKMMQKLGVTMEDFQEWAQKNNPESARAAFPLRSSSK